MVKSSEHELTPPGPVARKVTTCLPMARPLYVFEMLHGCVLGVAASRPTVQVDPLEFQLAVKVVVLPPLAGLTEMVQVGAATTVKVALQHDEPVLSVTV